MVGVVITLALVSATASGQDLGARSAAVVEVGGVSFHSDARLNLHLYLYGITGGGDSPRSGFAPEAEACFAQLGDAERSAWVAAHSFYEANIGERHHRRDPLMRAVRYGFTGLAPSAADHEEFGTLRALLEAAMPAYNACLWPAHDAHNRAWIDVVSGLLARHGEALQRSLAAAYQEEWPPVTVIDVVNYSDFAGANTMSGAEVPSHTTMSSRNPEFDGFKGLEILLHEASHQIFGVRWGRVATEIAAAAQQLEAETPRELWHAVSFFTSGEFVARVARSNGDPEFQPYALRRGMYEWAFPGYLEPLQAHWLPYLDGQTRIDDALRAVIGAIRSSG